MTTKALADEVQSFLSFLRERMTNPGEVWGVPTGFPSWDRLTGGLHPGEVTVIGARTSVGKTTLALQVSLTVLRSHPGLVVYCSPEMGRFQLLARIASQLAQVDQLSLVRGTVAPEVVNRVAERLTLPNFLDRFWVEDGLLELAALESQLEQESVLVERPLALVVIDYLQLVHHPAASAYDRATEVSRRIRALARSLNVPVLLLSQLKRPRDVDDPPTIHDLRDSGNIEQDADSVLLLHRPRLEDGGLSTTVVAELAKQRNGPTGTFRLLFQPETFTFRELGGGSR